MVATPETLNPEPPQVVERQEEFIVPETLQNSGVKVVQKNFKAQVKNNQGQSVISTPPAQVISITPPSDDATLLAWSKGDTASGLTWLAAFWIRIIKKAVLFGWQVVGRGQK